MQTEMMHGTYKTRKRKAKKDTSTEPAQMKGPNPTEPDKNISKTEEIT
jgi:hypothetical protein